MTHKKHCLRLIILMLNQSVDTVGMSSGTVVFLLLELLSSVTVTEDER